MILIDAHNGNTVQILYMRTYPNGSEQLAQVEGKRIALMMMD